MAPSIVETTLGDNHHGHGPEVPLNFIPTKQFIYPPRHFIKLSRIFILTQLLVKFSSIAQLSKSTKFNGCYLQDIRVATHYIGFIAQHNIIPKNKPIMHTTENTKCIIVEIVGLLWGVTCLGQMKSCSHTPHNTQCTANNLNITQAKQIHQSTSAQTRKT